MNSGVGAPKCLFKVNELPVCVVNKMSLDVAMSLQNVNIDTMTSGSNLANT